MTFSGDKLLGGPQAGIILGRPDIVERIVKDPLTRTYRLDKLTLAALEATLLLHRDEETAIREIPALAMLAADPDDIARRARRLAGGLRKAAPRFEVAVAAGTSEAGGGSLPTCQLPTTLVSLTPPAGVRAGDVAARLRQHDPPILVRVHEERILIDPRTLLEGDDGAIKAGLTGVLDSLTSEETT